MKDIEVHLAPAQGSHVCEQGTDQRHTVAEVDEMARKISWQAPNNSGKN